MASQALAVPAQPAGITASAAILAVTAVGLGLAAGFRWFGIGFDYVLYVEFYDRLGLDNDLGGERFEAGFTGGAWAFKHLLELSYNFYAAFLATAALAIKFALIAKHTRWPLLAALAYCGIFYPLHEYTQLRAGVALAFGLLAIDRYLDRRYMGAAIWLVVGTGFHTSVAVLGAAMLAFPLTQSRIGIGVLGGVAIAAGLGLVPGIDLFNLALQFPDIALRVVGDTVEAASPLKPSNVLLVAALLWLWLTDDVRDRDQRFHAFCCFASLIAYYLLIDIAVLAFRLQEMLSLPLVILAFRFAPGSPAMGAALITLVSAGYQLYADVLVGIFG